MFTFAALPFWIMNTHISGRKPTFTRKAAPLDTIPSDDATDGVGVATDGVGVARDMGEILHWSEHKTQTLPRKRKNAARVLWEAAQRSMSTKVFITSLFC